VPASIRREQPIVDDGHDLSALTRVDRGGIQPFHDKNRIYDCIRRLAIKVGWRQPAFVATAVTEPHAEFLAACRTP
jgi:hypothetical protein